MEKLKRAVLENHTYEIRAAAFKELLHEFIDKYKIAIKIPAPRWNEVHKWGDFYLAEGLLKEFTKKGYFIKLQILPEWDDSSDSMCDAVIVLRGLSQYVPKLQHKNIMWNISHPNNVKLKEYELYDHVFIASHKWADAVSSKVNVPVECLWQCTDTDRFYPDYSPEYHHELLFVGNSRKVHRKILKDLLPTEHELAVYGADWEDLIDDKYIIDEFIDITKYVIEQKENLKYQLICACKHFAYPENSDQYISYCKNKISNQWYKFNDSACNICNFKEVSQGRPYLLLYEKIK